MDYKVDFRIQVMVSCRSGIFGDIMKKLIDLFLRERFRFTEEQRAELELEDGVYIVLARYYWPEEVVVTLVGDEEKREKIRKVSGKLLVISQH